MISAPNSGPLTIGFRALLPGLYSFSYSVSRLAEQGEILLSSIATVFITLLAAQDPDDGDDEDGDDEDSDDESAALPDTGAADNLIIGGTGIGLTILGMFRIVAIPRRRVGSRRA